MKTELLDKKILLTIVEASAITGLDEHYIRQMVEEGRIKRFLPPYRKNFKISRVALEEFISAHEVSSNNQQITI